MKVFHVLHGFAPEMTGGTERTVEAVARAMQAAGHDVAIVTGSIEPAPSSRVDDFEHDGLRVLRLHREDLYYESWLKAWSPLVGETFRALLERERPDVVHVHHWIRLTSDLVRIARAAGCRVVATTAHDYFSMFATPARRFGEDAPEPPPCDPCVSDTEAARALALHRDDFFDELCAADMRYAPSRAHAEGLAACAPGDLGELRVARPPLLDVPARLPTRSTRGKKLVTWGSIYPDKGIDLVLDAMFSIGGGWTLDVYGEAHDPAYRERLHARAKAMPVTFHGAFGTSDLAAIDADYAVLPSMCEESYGLTIDEAQCLGLPILAADLAAFREHAPAASTAFFRPSDPGELAMLLLDDAKLAALTRPEPPATWTADDAAEHLLADYASVADRPRPDPTNPRVTPARRATESFRRAEWRHWTALQHGDRRAPPSDYLS